MAHAHCMLNTWGYKNTLRICTTYCFPLPQFLHERTRSVLFPFLFLRNSRKSLSLIEYFITFVKMSFMSDDNTKPIKTKVFLCLSCSVASFVLREFRLRSKSFGQQLIRRLGRTQSHSGHCKEENISCPSQNRTNICLYSSLYTKHYRMNNHSSSDRPISEEIQINIKF